jgi:hypothetical protein
MKDDISYPLSHCELCKAVTEKVNLVFRYVIRKNSNLFICAECMKTEQTLILGQPVSNCDGTLETMLEPEDQHFIQPILDGDMTLREAKDSGRRVFDDSIGIPLGGMAHQLGKIRDMFKCYSRK